MNFVICFFYFSDKLGIPILIDIEGKEDSHQKL